MIGAIGIALNGLDAAMRKLDASATDIASGISSAGTGGGGDLITDAVDLHIAETEFKANLVTVRAADEMTRTLLNSFDRKV